MTAHESSNALRRTVARRLSEATAALPLSSLRRLQFVSDVAARSGFRRLVRLLPSRGSWTKADRRAVERVAVALGRLKGVPMKLGQLASYIDSSVPADLRPAFAALESHAQALPYHRIEAAVRKSLGPRASGLLSTMESRPFAVASIGQVHRARIDGELVAVKIRYPGIEQAVRLDFRPAAFGTWAMMGFSGEHGETLIKQVLQHILDECDYAREAERQHAFAACFEEHPVIRVPPTYPDYSTDTVLTAQFVDGLPLDAFLATAPSPQLRRRASLALLDFYVGSIFLLGAYNSDPHPGNYLFCPDGRIAFIDHGSGRTFGNIAGIRALARAVVNNDRVAIREALGTLGLLSADRRVDERPLMHVLMWLFGPML
ncbi:MAG: AarF/UbiB family protein, partial [Myxococcota bacterium]